MGLEQDLLCSGRILKCWLPVRNLQANHIRSMLTEGRSSFPAIQVPLLLRRIARRFAGSKDSPSKPAHTKRDEKTPKGGHPTF